MSVADQLGFGPKREVMEGKDGGAVVTVTAPVVFVRGARPVRVVLSPSEYEGYKKWRNGELIQRALPTMSLDRREQLMTGLDDEAFHKAVGNDE